MAPLRVFTNWNLRPSDELTQIEPYRRYFMICEGENTEKWYFERLISERKTLNINSNIDVRFVERSGDELHQSNPVKLIEHGKKIMGDESSGYEEGDVIVLVFDVDIYKPNKLEELQNVINAANDNGFWVGITNPSFELFLLLHIEDAYSKYILPNATAIMEKKNRRAARSNIQKLLTECVKMNPKTNKNIGSLATRIDIAIEQEQFINRELDCCMEKITSNIGKIIEKIREAH